jgi:dipeptidase E
MLNLALTSDFPSTTNQAVIDSMKASAPNPRVAWIPPLTAMGRVHFPAARQLFESYGFPALEYCDIDEEPNEGQLARLDQYDIIYLSGGDPIVFRRNILRTGLPTRLRQFLASGKLIVAASGGSMQLTENVSLFRLLTETFDEVFSNRDEYEAVGVVGYEILPHFDRLEPSFVEKVRCYSERVPHDVIALANGAAVVHATRDEYRTIGQAAKFCNGVMTMIDAGSEARSSG